MPKAGRRHRARASRRLAALALTAALLAPGPGWAQAEEDPGYGGLRRGADIVFDVLVLRPVAALTLAVGAGLFVPVAWMASPGGPDMVEEGWERFVLRPGQQLWGRPLGEF